MEEQTKWCAGCVSHQPLTNYHRHARTGDGLQVYCKQCNARMVREAKAKRNKTAELGKGGKGQHGSMTPYMAYYGAILRSTGHKWEDVAKAVNVLIEKEGKAPLRFISIQNRVKKFMEKSGSTFGAEVIPYLHDMEESNVIDYMLGNLLVEYEQAKVDKNSKKALALSSKITELIFKRHQMRKTEETEGFDAFSELITKTVTADVN